MAGAAKVFAETGLDWFTKIHRAAGAAASVLALVAPLAGGGLMTQAKPAAAPEATAPAPPAPSPEITIVEEAGRVAGQTTAEKAAHDGPWSICRMTGCPTSSPRSRASRSRCGRT